MRLIQTHFYFADSHIDRAPGTGRARRAHWEYPGVSAVWISAERGFSRPRRTTDALYINDISDFSGRQINYPHVPHFIDFALQDAHGSAVVGRFFDWPHIENIDLVRYLESQEVVVQRSPPEASPLATLLKNASVLSVGTFIGTQAADAMGYPLLLGATIAGGLLIVGSALGVSRGLENGLAKRVERWINPHDDDPPKQRK